MEPTSVIRDPVAQHTASMALLKIGASSAGGGRHHGHRGRVYGRVPCAALASAVAPPPPGYEIRVANV